MPTSPTTFSYTGTEDSSFVVPTGVTSITVDMAGAAGGGEPAFPLAGAKGGRLQATLTTTPGETLRVGVGGAGSDTNGNVPTPGVFYAGAAGGLGGPVTNSGGGGGGQSYVKRGGSADANRVLVAGGGGGQSANTVGGVGGLTLHTESTTATAATPGAADGINGGGGGGGGGWVGGTGGAVNAVGSGGDCMAHSTQTSSASAASGFQAGNGYVTFTWVNPSAPVAPDPTGGTATVTTLVTAKTGIAPDPTAGHGSATVLVSTSLPLTLAPTGATGVVSLALQTPSTPGNFLISAPVEIVEHSTSPLPPPANQLLLYPKTDNKLYQQTSAGVETVVGGSGSSAVPTLLAASTTFTVADNTQALYRRQIVLAAGAQIVVGSNAVLEGVA